MKHHLFLQGGGGPFNDFCHDGTLKSKTFPFEFSSRDYSHNLGQNILEQLSPTPRPHKAMMKSRRSKSAPFCIIEMGVGVVQMFHLFCPRLQGLGKGTQKVVSQLSRCAVKISASSYLCFIHTFLELKTRLLNLSEGFCIDSHHVLLFSHIDVTVAVADESKPELVNRSLALLWLRMTRFVESINKRHIDVKLGLYRHVQENHRFRNKLRVLENGPHTT